MASKKRPVTLADLRRAAPEGWRVAEDRWENGETRVSAHLPADCYYYGHEVDVSHPDRQTARRAALAALNAMGKEER